MRGVRRWGCGSAGTRRGRGPGARPACSSGRRSRGSSGTCRCTRRTSCTRRGRAGAPRARRRPPLSRRPRARRRRAKVHPQSGGRPGARRFLLGARASRKALTSASRGSGLRIVPNQDRKGQVGPGETRVPRERSRRPRSDGNLVRSIERRGADQTQSFKCDPVFVRGSRWISARGRERPRAQLRGRPRTDRR